MLTKVVLLLWSLCTATGFKYSFTPFIRNTNQKLLSITDVDSVQFLDDKAELFSVGLDTVLDIFSSDSKAVSRTAYTSDVFIKFEPKSSTDLSSGDKDFILPDTRAWRTAVTETITAPDPSFVNPPDVISLLHGATLSSYHENKVKELLDKTPSLSYLSYDDSAVVFQALRVAYCAFWGKTTMRSMEVLINRARGTAAVLGELKADLNVVVAGILHDVLSELPSPDVFRKIKDVLAEMFGHEAIALVEAYCRMPRFGAKSTNYTPIHSENQMQMLVALAEDYRALYIRLADRLHTMRVLRNLPLLDEVKMKISQEALHVYAPLAHKMNVMIVKGELEDLAFRVLKPDLYLDSERMQWLAHKALHDGAGQIQDMMESDPYLLSQNITYRLPYRVKDKYQLALKMARKGLSSVNQVRDAVGMRVIFDTPRQSNETEQDWVARSHAICYHIVSRLRELSGWEPADRGFKDYIAHKKENGYQSLHQYMRNTAMNTFLEVQVRTMQMHMLAELGEAAHWNYKDQIIRPEIASSKLYTTAWRSFEQTRAKSAAEMIGLAKKQLNAKRVFVFLEDESTVINLRKGATALDVAFAIHTSIGLSAKSVSINGHAVGFKRVVQNGDVIRVECSKDEVMATSSWLQLARLSYTHAIIRKYMRHRHRSILVVLGSVQLVASLFLNKGVVLRFFESMPSLAQMQKLVTKHTNFDSFADFLSDLGSRAKSEEDVAVKLGVALGIPSEDLTVFSFSQSLQWVKAQLKEPVREAGLKSLYLLPLLKVILPAAGLSDAAARWKEVVGESLDDCQAQEAPTTVSVDVSSGSSSRTEQDWSRSMGRSSGRHRAIHSKSPIMKAQTPYSLEASSLSSPLQRLAKLEFATRIGVLS